MSGRAARATAGMMDRSVREALRGVLSNDLCEEVLTTALELAGEDVVPEEASRARGFVEGPLSLALHRLVGIDIADSVVGYLDPVLELAESHVRMREPADVDRPERPTAPAKAQPVRDVATLPPPIPVPTPVLMATMDRSNLKGVARTLTGYAVVRQVTDVFELLSALDTLGSQRVVVVLDCCLPAVDAVTVVEMLTVVPKNVRFVLWGARKSVRQEMAALDPRTRDWLAIPAEASHEELAILLKTLL